MSIVSGSIEPELIRALLGENAEVLVDLCVARGLTGDNEGAVAFRHELAIQATLDRLPPSLQRSLHEKAEKATSTMSAADGNALLSQGGPSGRNEGALPSGS
jgi:hypothetical protein